MKIFLIIVSTWLNGAYLTTQTRWSVSEMPSWTACQLVGRELANMSHVEYRCVQAPAGAGQ